MKDTAIKLENVSKVFKLNKMGSGSSKSHIDEIKSIDNISMEIEKGKMIGIIGKNGSGKTTLLRLMGGIFQPNFGKIMVKGRIGPLLHIGTGINEELTLRENIITYGILLGFSKEWIKGKIKEILDFAELLDYENAKIKHLSSGMRVRAMFSTALQIDPDILLVDEIISVGDFSFRRKSFEKFLSFKNNNKTIVLVSHNLEIVKKLCDEVYFLDSGKIIENGNPEETIKKYQEFYSKKNNN
jgi:ABC-type polysaccharide/polyol phosphate transport system ATPase subunit